MRLKNKFHVLLLIVVLVILSLLLVLCQIILSERQGGPVQVYYETCGYNFTFSQIEVEGICAPEPSVATKRSVCPAVHISHLSHRDFRSSVLKLPPSAGGQATLTIFVHPAKDYISNTIVSTGGWDNGGVGWVTRALVALPGAALVDIGCNLGVFSLRAAHLGRRVVSIDANYQNVIRLRKSVLANSFEDRVQIFWNAMGTKPRSLRVRLPTDCNIGGGIPTEAMQSDWIKDPIEVRTVGLDDLLIGNHHLKGKIDIVIKIDTDDCEWCIIATASETFNRYRVPMVLMEWRGTQIFHPEKADFLLDFFDKRNYTAYDLFGKNPKPVRLSNENHKTWPGDVLWLNAQGHKMLNQLLQQ